jgi:quinol monooxygenase YgiN
VAQLIREDGSVTTVRLTGRLICATDDEAATVARHLPTHIALTRAEPGCESFEVSRSDEPRVWLVSERFRDAAAFRAHQARVGESEWGRATAGIERRYDIHGL